MSIPFSSPVYILFEKGRPCAIKIHGIFSWASPLWERNNLVTKCAFQPTVKHYLPFWSYGSWSSYFWFPSKTFIISSISNNNLPMPIFLDFKKIHSRK
jgi:hypothetical protein